MKSSLYKKIKLNFFSVTDIGIVIPLMLVQPLNEYSRIVATEFLSSSTLLMFESSLNA